MDSDCQRAWKYLMSVKNTISDLYNFVSELKPARGLFVGSVRGISIPISLFAEGTIVFSGALADYLMPGIGIFFIGSIVLTFILAIWSQFPAPFGTSSLPALFVLVVIAQSIPLQGKELYMTFIFTVFCCAFLTGISFYFIGRFKLANLFRFIPSVVASGTLAGSGLLILLLSLSMVGIRWDNDSLTALLIMPNALNWILGISFGISILIVMRIWKSFLVLPVMFFTYCLLFHTVLNLFGTSMEEARSMQFFWSGNWDAGLWPTFALEDISRVNWNEVAAQFLNIGVYIVLLTVITVIGYTQLEIGSDTEFDWNREFKVTGVANVISGSAGGIPGAISAPASLPHIRYHGNTPVTSLVIVAVMLAVVGFGAEFIQLVPVSANCGVLISLSVPLIHDNLIKNVRRLPYSEAIMLGSICGTMIFWGFLEGIALGLLLCIVFFVFRVSQLDIVESSTTLCGKNSKTVRSIPDQAILYEYGLRTQIYILKGYLFFGSAFALTSTLKNALGKDPKSLSVLIDFSKVTGFDLSTLESLRTYILRATEEKVHIVFSSSSALLRSGLKRDLPETVFSSLYWADDLDQALAQCEEITLDAWRADSQDQVHMRDKLRDQVIVNLMEQLDRQSEFEALVNEVGGEFLSRHYEPNEEITSIGDLQTGLQLLVSGRATVLNSEGTRMKQLLPGAVIEVSSSIEPTVSEVSIIAEEPCQTLLIARQDLARIEQHSASKAFDLYRYICRTS